MFSLRQYWPRRSFSICHHKCLPTLECPLWQTRVGTQYFLNSYMFFTFRYIWWTGSRKLGIDNVPSLPCLPKTWSNHIHCQAGCSLGLFLWRSQPRIDFNKIQCWEQPCIVYFLSNIHAFSIGQSPYNRGSCGWVQWLRISLPMQGTRVQALVQEDPTCRGATKPVSHNYWARVLQLLKPERLEPMLCNKRSHHNEKPVHCNKE